MKNESEIKNENVKCIEDGKQFTKLVKNVDEE